MFSGNATRSFTLAVVVAQVVVSVVLAAVIPAPQSMARQSVEQIDWEPSDIMQVADASQSALAIVEAMPSTGLQHDEADAEAQESWQEAASDEDLASYEADSEAWCSPSVVEGSCYSSEQLRQQGVIYDGEVRYTWYSQRVLPGGGLNIEGRHVSSEGYVVDANERIVVASSDLPWGSEVPIPFGDGVGVVLDCGCEPGVIDVYTDF